MRFAYERSPRSRGLEPFEVAGGPDWIVSDRFDVNATAGREVSLTELRSEAYQAFRGLTMDDLAIRLYPYLGGRVPNPYDGRVLPSIFSVLPQQLGLRLESQRAPVDILIVDHAERPTED